MTVKGAKRKQAEKPGVLKSQLAQERSKGDQALEAVGQLTSLVQQLMKKVEELPAVATRASVLANHDQSERVAREVLREDNLDDSIPEKPDAVIPAHLKAAGKALDARNSPVEVRKTVESGDTEIGEYAERVMSSTGPASESLAPLKVEDDGIIVENRHWSREKYALEMFMQELVCIRIHDTSDETMPAMPEVHNGGQSQYFIRMNPQWVKRLFIEPLARAKRTTYTQRETLDSEGRRTFVQIPHTALLYPFEILQDSEKGKRWVRSILAEPY